jgi:hypothetical protein
MNIEKQFQAAVEDYLAASGMRDTALGMQALNDPSFVARVRSGRNFKVRTVDRVIEWMNKNPPVSE